MKKTYVVILFLCAIIFFDQRYNFSKQHNMHNSDTSRPSGRGHQVNDLAHSSPALKRHGVFWTGNKTKDRTVIMGIDHKDHDPKMMHGMFGNYPMTREGSGTSWFPDSSPQEGFHIIHNDWKLMFNGFSSLIADFQGGKRGGNKIFDSNMFMFMGQKDFNTSTLAFKTMFSAEPFTIGKCGYPLLLQTGETCNGITQLIDRQHPHDLFMELAAAYSYTMTKDSSVFIYFGLPGEPALGPPVYKMRFSGEYIPATPITHHWLDSTHISFGVLTLGMIYKNAKLEVSTFNGREPDQYRYNIEKPKFNSWSLRFTLNPTENLSLQVSHGFLKSPEQLTPNVNIKRTTLSIMHNKEFNDNNIQTTAAFGLNREIPGHTLPAFLIESTLEIHKKHVIFGRFEIVDKEDLFIAPDPLSEKIFNVQKLSAGYIYEFIFAHHLKWGVGGLLDFSLVPHEIKNRYGNTISGMFFLQVKLI